jgi:mannose-6-phosphate isomerase-like protein (cupin superfamily)
MTIEDHHERRRLHRSARSHSWLPLERRWSPPLQGRRISSVHAITRQNLFKSDNLACELRYFEVAPNGFSTLERHQHMHAVLILRGHGRCLLDDQVYDLAPHDLVTIPPWTWQQFRATAGEPLGFLCMVNANWDRPQLPSDEDLHRIKAHPAVRACFEVPAQP